MKSCKYCNEFMCGYAGEDRISEHCGNKAIANDKCSRYSTRKERRIEYDQYDGHAVRGHDVDIPVCDGTKERDMCSCGGDKTKCDFYPKIREEAKANVNKKLDDMELEFYRWYIVKNNLLWDVLNEYNKWKNSK